MGTLIAATKTEIYKVLDCDNPFDKINTDNITGITYDFETQLVGDEQWFEIPKFSTTNYAIDLIKKDFTPVNYKEIASVKDLQKKSIVYICYVEDGMYYFQKIYTSNMVSGKLLFGWFRAPEIKENEVLVIEKIPHIIYDKTKDNIFFKRLETMNGIFKGINTISRDATEQEVKDFINNANFKIPNNFDDKKVNSENRKRIYHAKQRIQAFTPDQWHERMDYAKLYFPGLVTEEGGNKKFDIKSNADITNIIFALLERLYITPYTKEQMIATSTRKA